MGIVLGWSSPMVIMLENPDTYVSPIQEKYATENWLIAVALLAASLSAAFAGFLMDKFGRKHVITMVALPSVFSWLLTILVPNILMLYVARIVQGLMFGLSATVVPVYIGEISDPAIRGKHPVETK